MKNNEQENIVLKALKDHFGFDSLREGQREPIIDAISGKDVLVIMPTGAGKSLCYQLPALILPGTTLVVSPLIALMKDQVDNLNAKGIPAAYINSSLTPAKMNETLENLTKDIYKLVYVAPERFRSEIFVEKIRNVKISLFVIDEAHCISQWGHDFRPDYLTLRSASKLFNNIGIMAVTATATPDVRRDIIAQLGLGTAPRKPPSIYVHGFARNNLDINVRTCPNHFEKLNNVKDCIKKFHKGIIYCATTKQAERTYQSLQALNPIAASLAIMDSEEANKITIDGHKCDLILYHGKLTDKQRAVAHERFIKSQNPIVVATNAFGMGVDRADIRFVIHWDIPGSVEAYYQEIGRAGRDGAPSYCELLFNYVDIKTQEFLIDKTAVERLEAEHCNIEEIRRVRESRLQKLNIILAFAKSRKCRHQGILDYFGEEMKNPCPGCDNCHKKLSEKDEQVLVEWQWTVIQKILSCVARMKGRFGRTRITQVLLGDEDPILEEKGLTSLSTYGILKNFPPELLHKLLTALVETECIEVSNDNYHTMSITEKGIAVAKRQYHNFTLRWPNIGYIPKPRKRTRKW